MRTVGLDSREARRLRASPGIQVIPCATSTTFIVISLIPSSPPT
jgi:hypothetical protein